MRTFGIVMLVLQLALTIPLFFLLLFPPFLLLWLVFFIIWIVCIVSGGTKRVKVVQ